MVQQPLAGQCLLIVEVSRSQLIGPEWAVSGCSKLQPETAHSPSKHKDFKHELLNQLRSTMAVKVLTKRVKWKLSII